jgi:hypothetical protein
MNLSDCRTRLFSQVDWAPTQSTDALARLDAFINRAYNQLALEAPFLFFEDQLLLATQADVVPQAGYTAPLDRVSVRPDTWVLNRSVDITLPDYVSWDQTGLWSGRMIEVTDPNGRVHRHRIRQVFQLAIGNDNFQAVTLYRPWHNTSDVGMDYRIYTDSYSMPDDVIQVNSIRLAKSNQNWPLDIVGQLEAEKLSLADAPGTISAGVPRTAFRRAHRKMVPEPTEAPILTQPSIDWVGPEPAGQFSYCFTYYWGIRDTEVQNPGPGGTILTSQAARNEALWESSPSPISATATATNTGTTAIRVSTPNIDQMLGFNRTGTERLNKAGIRKRIYRRRHTVDETNYNTGGGNLTDVDTFGARIEAPDKYFLLADQAGNDTTFDDNGLLVPDYFRPLRDTHGYQALAFYPRPDARYEVDIRGLRRPKTLVDPEDTPRIHVDAIECLLWKTAVLLYESMGNIKMADRAELKYKDYLFTMTKRYGELSYPSEPLQRKPARASQIVNTRKPWKRWYNLP